MIIIIVTIIAVSLEWLNLRYEPFRAPYHDMVVVIIAYVYFVWLIYKLFH